MDKARINLTRETGSLFRAALVAGFLERKTVLDECDVEVDGEDLFFELEDAAHGDARDRIEDLISKREIPCEREERFEITGATFASTADRLEGLVRSFVWRADDDAEEVDVEELFRANAGDLVVLGRLVEFAERALERDRIVLGGGAGSTTALRVERLFDASATLLRGRTLLAKSLREHGSDPVRVLRVLAYEGPANLVATQLANSLPDGVRDLRNGLQIVVVSDAVELLSKREV